MAELAEELKQGDKHNRDLRFEQKKRDGAVLRIRSNSEEVRAYQAGSTETGSETQGRQMNQLQRQKSSAGH